MKEFFLLPVLLFSCCFGCRPIVRQEPASAVQVAVAVNGFKQLMESRNYKAARKFITSHLDKNNKHLARETIGSYLKEGNQAGISDFLRSYTHSAHAVVLDKEINDLIARIATSDSEQDIAKLLTQVEERTYQIKSLYFQRDRVLVTTPPGKESYGLMIETRNDFDSWSRGMQEKLNLSVRKYAQRTGINWPEKLRARLLEMHDSLAAFYRSIGLRPLHGYGTR